MVIRLMLGSLRRAFFVAAIACNCIPLAAQQIWPKPSTAKDVEAVEYLYPEQITVPAGKVSSVNLHFRVNQGLHINSHTPKSEYLIPTVFSIPDGLGVKLDGAYYPAGEMITLPIDPHEKLLVYSGEFTIQARIVAALGDHLVEAKLRYQACDQNACMPPKTIPVVIDVIGK